MNPFSPSKIGAGPVMPSPASSAANTPFRAALENAQAFHIETSPTRVCRRATFATPARLTACVVAICDNLKSFAAPSAEENGP